MDLAEVGVSPCDPSDLKGGSVSDNLALLNDFAEQKNALMTKGLKESIYLNAGAAFYAAEQVDSIKSGVQYARETVQSGRLLEWLFKVRAFYKDRQ